MAQAEESHGLCVNDMIVAINGKVVGGMTEVGVEIELEISGPCLQLVVSRYKHSQEVSNKLASTERQMLQVMDNLARDDRLLGWLEVGNAKPQETNRDSLGDLPNDLETESSLCGESQAQTKNPPKDATKDSRATGRLDSSSLPKEAASEDKGKNGACGSEDDWSNSADDQNAHLGCICGEVHEKGEMFWIQCSNCKSWYDVSRACVGFAEEEAESISNWTCAACPSSNDLDNEASPSDAKNGTRAHVNAEHPRRGISAFANGQSSLPHVEIEAGGTSAIDNEKSDQADRENDTDGVSSVGQNEKSGHTEQNEARSAPAVGNTQVCPQSSKQVDEGYMSAAGSKALESVADAIDKAGSAHQQVDQSHNLTQSDIKESMDGGGAAGSDGSDSNPMGDLEKSELTKPEADQGDTNKVSGPFDSLQARRTSDGGLRPKSKPVVLEDGTFKRPKGKPPTGLEWNAVRGVWAPKDIDCESERVQHRTPSPNANKSAIRKSRVSVKELSGLTVRMKHLNEAGSEEDRRRRPRTRPKQLDDGSFIRPPGPSPKGMKWNKTAGLWASIKSASSRRSLRSSTDPPKPTNDATKPENDAPQPANDVPVLQPTFSDANTVHNVGALVNVDPHSWAGKNCFGGVGHVKKSFVDKNGVRLYSVKYVVGGTDRDIGAEYVHAHQI